ncbi:MAG: hypothetical protein HY519_03425 [Candidatus Aenigmarchaeota archaeon]|nr:hypothetical protein [Candidatus Aenigmarchaeota archaeon]
MKAIAQGVSAYCEAIDGYVYIPPATRIVTFGQSLEETRDIAAQVVGKKIGFVEPGREEKRTIIELNDTVADIESIYDGDVTLLKHETIAHLRKAYEARIMKILRLSKRGEEYFCDHMSDASKLFDALSFLSIKNFPISKVAGTKEKINRQFNLKSSLLSLAREMRFDMGITEGELLITGCEPMLLFEHFFPAYSEALQLAPYETARGPTNSLYRTCREGKVLLDTQLASTVPEYQPGSRGIDIYDHGEKSAVIRPFAAESAVKDEGDYRTPDGAIERALAESRLQAIPGKSLPMRMRIFGKLETADRQNKERIAIAVDQEEHVTPGTSFHGSGRYTGNVIGGRYLYESGGSYAVPLVLTGRKI